MSLIMVGLLSFLWVCPPIIVCSWLFHYWNIQNKLLVLFKSVDVLYKVMRVWLVCKNLCEASYGSHALNTSDSARCRLRFRCQLLHEQTCIQLCNLQYSMMIEIWNFKLAEVSAIYEAWSRMRANAKRFCKEHFRDVKYSRCSFGKQTPARDVACACMKPAGCKHIQRCLPQGNKIAASCMHAWTKGNHASTYCTIWNCHATI